MSLGEAVSPKLYYTNDPGPDNVQLTPLQLGHDDPDSYLDSMTARILYAYNELLRLLGGDSLGAIRLQSGLAAAAAGLSISEFFALAKEDQNSHCTKFVKVPLHHQLAPSLILYLGPKKKGFTTRIPCTSGHLLFDGVPDPEFWPWDPPWEEDGVSFTSWGWSTRTLAPQHHFIFLSGAFLGWPACWKSVHSEKLLLVFLKVTIYHELAHYLRNLVGGLNANNLTPEKCIDHRSQVCQTRDHSQMMGEGGRMAEKIAFGSVIDLSLSKLHEPMLVFFAQDEPGCPAYQIQIDTIDRLFNLDQKSAPINIARVIKAQQPINPSDIAFSRYKESHQPIIPLMGSNIPYQILRTPERPQHVESSVGWSLITGDLAAHINAQRPYLEELKGSCVVIE